MKYNIEWLLSQVDGGRNFEYIFFWGGRPNPGGKITKSCLSQWFPCYFEVQGIKYFTAEQYMMEQKAVLFGDNKTRARIMAASMPNQFKNLGKQVRPFNSDIWDAHKKEIVVRGNLAKFTQHDAFKNFLISTDGMILAEASPYDTIWGIGMSENEPEIEDPKTWRGENNLGFALMEVRDELNKK